MVAVEDARVEHFLTLPKEYPQITQIKNKEKGTVGTNRDNTGRAASVQLPGF
jgi:hypothetical protein